MLALVLVWGSAWTTLLFATHGSADGAGPGFGWLTKALLEYASVVLLGLAAGLCLWGWLCTRQAHLCWLTAVVVLFFARELHFAGTPTAVYVGITTMAVIAMWKPRWAEHVLVSRAGATLFAMAFACYLFAVSLDGNWWFDWDARWKDAAILAEEVMEFSGHAVIFGLVCIAPKLRARDRPEADPAGCGPTETGPAEDRGAAHTES